MTTQNKTPASVATLTGATKFQNSKQILTHVLNKFVAIFSGYLALGDLLPFIVLAVVILVGAF